MTKFGLIVPLFFFLICGCALFDSSEMTSEQPAVPAPVVENETTKVVTAVQAVPVEAKVAPARSLTRDEIRTLQLRLREVGFDPGPVDGVAGAKTKAAFARFQSGCSNVRPLMENASEATAQNLAVSQAADKVPGRQETQAIQIQLRNAGFNPGPVDGIFGNKTRSVLARLKADCPTVNEFAGILGNPLRPSSKPALATHTLETNSAKLQSLSAAGRSDATKQPAAPAVSARSQEDIRILQLRLRDAGFDPGPFDGVMGPKTKAALQQYQVAQRGNNVKLPVISGISGQYLTDQLHRQKGIQACS
ncbi:MAG TPA: peptidoglycan-binding domain-containing protein [Candidatus Binatia bacterium]|nr:peptidoglycan-binding domain-containing protein [Candidatus Binatia bacterium]